MPRSTELQNYRIDVGTGEIVSPSDENGSEPSVVPVWRIDLISHQGDRIWFTLTEEMRDELVRKLTSGIFIAKP